MEVIVKEENLDSLTLTKKSLIFSAVEKNLLFSALNLKLRVSDATERSAFHLKTQEKEINNKEKWNINRKEKKLVKPLRGSSWTIYFYFGITFIVRPQ